MTEVRKMRHPLTMENAEAIHEYVQAAGPSRWAKELMAAFEEAWAAQRRELASVILTGEELLEEHDRQVREQGRCDNPACLDCKTRSDDSSDGP